MENATAARKEKRAIAKAEIGSKGDARAKGQNHFSEREIRGAEGLVQTGEIEGR